MILYRPVGLEALRLIYDADMRAFPPRLPDQPIFYPVTNDGYAKQIAKDLEHQERHPRGIRHALHREQRQRREVRATNRWGS